eukprot:gnl/MRDRNA2_/MRDRNA2_222813_c0_seq1.p1 gnl/MRDRNA2_/MRDRNA2_222813_c0~~gnl/MRDRNA2_/MRDRNA2_222813_c0_seq1.p1  ORF type:complete len:195 (+),score=21.37 gnl/MRDRNA2_/MRDRNA2_222813_c0_seq1:30-587(+)
MARIHVQSDAAASCKSVKVALVHHGRDYPPGCSEVVGFFTDFRILETHVSNLSSLLGVFYQVLVAIRDRNWRRPEVLERNDILVNVIPSVCQQIGPLEQVRMRQPRDSTGKIWQCPKSKPLKRAVDLQIEQVDVMTWSSSMHLDEHMYPRETGRLMADIWLQTIEDFCKMPLSPVFKEHYTSGQL